MSHTLDLHTLDLLEELLTDLEARQDREGLATWEHILGLCLTYHDLKTRGYHPRFVGDLRQSRLVIEGGGRQKNSTAKETVDQRTAAVSLEQSTDLQQPQKGICMLPCITCNQSLPEGTTEHPGYFAQSSRSVSADDDKNLATELENILEYIDTLLLLLPAAQEVSKDCVDQLGWLGGDLCKEAQRRLARLR